MDLQTVITLATTFAELKKEGIVDVEVVVDEPCVRVQNLKVLRELFPNTHLTMVKHEEVGLIEYSYIEKGVKFLWAGKYARKEPVQ